jgi:hypothetical protein
MYFFRYRNEDTMGRSSATAATARGSAIHDGVACNYEQKASDGVLMQVDEVTDITRDAVDGLFAGDISLTKEERSIGLRHVRDAVKDQAVLMARHHALRVAPFVKPTHVEKTIRVSPHPDLFPIDLTGRIDVIVEKRIVRDLKTKKAVLRTGDEGRDQQLTMYAMLFEAEFGRLPDSTDFDVLTMAPGGDPSFERRESTRNRSDFAGLLGTLRSVESSIQSGIFPPTDPTNWICSEKWCPYFRRCPYTKGRRER